VRIEMRIDAITRTIDSRDPQLLALWVLEILSEVQWNAATLCQIWCWPSFAPGAGADRWANPLPDWIQDSRFMGYPIKARTPEELLEGLGEQLRTYREAQK
jgi:hypothetical protein